MRKLEAYIEELASADQFSGLIDAQRIQDELWNVVKSQPEICEEKQNHIKDIYDGVVRSLRNAPDSCARGSELLFVFSVLKTSNFQFFLRIS